VIKEREQAAQRGERALLSENDIRVIFKIKNENNLFLPQVHHYSNFIEHHKSTLDGTLATEPKESSFSTSTMLKVMA
jgi:hypothetical protein